MISVPSVLSIAPWLAPFVPRGGDGKEARLRNLLLYVAALLVVIWLARLLLGLLSGAFNLLLLIAVVLVLINLVTRRR